MEKQIKIALAGNPNCGKTTLFNALTGSNQFVGNWPGVTVEKKEGKLKKHDDVVIMDLPGIYSLSPYTLEEVVARNYLITERPDAILNIIDGTNLERNLYLTTQLTELGIPVVIAINMMDIVRKNGDEINVKELSRELGCEIIEISALKGDGVMDAAEAAIRAAKGTKTVPMHTFSGPVEHAIAHIEEAAVHSMPEEQQRWYAIKIFERDDKVLEKLSIPTETMNHIEEDIKAAETELDDDAESIITNERYIYIAQLIKGCYKKKSTEKLSASDKIDKVVTNRWLGLPIFAVVMFLVYWVAMVGVGAPATDWANDGVFGDGWHLLGIGSAAYGEASDDYTAASEAINAFAGIDTGDEEFDADTALEEIKDFQPTEDTATVDVEDEETLAINEMTAYYDAIPDDADEDSTVGMTYVDAVSYFEENGFDEPDPADYGVWVPGVPVLIGDALDAAGTADWLNGLILDGIVAGVGAVLGFVPQMLVLFLMLAFLEACGYMARIAFVLDRVFRKFGLSGKSFIPMLIGVGCGVPGIMASRTIENERDRRMTIMTTTFIPCGAKVPFMAMIAGAIFGGSISAILIHTPGTPASAATAIEGYQLTLQGKAGKALAVACFSSFCGGLLSCISLYFFAPLLAQLAMKFGSPEYFWLSIFGLTIIAGVASKSLLKGLISGALGLLLSTIGMDPMEGAQRFMFGQASLYEGINTTCALIGLFSMSQVLILAEKKIKQRAKAAKFSDKITLSGKEIKRITPTILCSWIIGNLIGILPGAGASIACFLGYNTSRQFSHHKEEFGKGSIEGVAGSEAANNAVTGGSLIPMLTLGIPGESVTAVLMGGLIIQGLQPGPELFTRYAPMTYTFFAGFVLVQFFMLGIGLLGCRGFAQISRLSDAILIPSVAVLCVVGSFAIHKNFFDVVIMMIFGVLGYLVRKFDLNPAAIVLALILGPIGENGLRRSLRLSGGSPAILFSTPLCWVLIALCVFGVCSPIFMNRMEKKAVENAGGDIPDETGDDPVRTSD